MTSTERRTLSVVGVMLAGAALALWGASSCTRRGDDVAGADTPTAVEPGPPPPLAISRRRPPRHTDIVERARVVDVRVRVVDGDGRPASTVNVVCDDPLRDGAAVGQVAASTTTDAAGHASLRLELPATVSDLRVTAGPRGGAGVAIEAVRAEIDTTIVLPVTAAIRGRVVTPDGGPPTETLVIEAIPASVPSTLRHPRFDDDPTRPLPVRTAADGTFEVRGVVRGAAYDLGVVGGDWIRHPEPPSTGWTVAANGGDEGVVITVTQTVFVCVRLVDAQSGQPVAAAPPDATILVRDPGSGRAIEARHPFSFTLADGRSLRGPIPPDAPDSIVVPVPRPRATHTSQLAAFEVFVEVPGYRPAAASLRAETAATVAAGGAATQLRLAPVSDAVTGRCRLVARETWRSAAGVGRDARVVALSRVGFPPLVRGGTRSIDGAWEFAGLPAGEYSACLADAFGLESRPTTVVLGPDAPVEAVFDYDGITAVRLHCFDADGSTVFEPTVMLTVDGSSAELLPREMLAPSLDASGVLRMPTIPSPPGRLRAVAERRGVGVGSAEIDVAPGTVVDVRITLRRTPPESSAAPSAPR